MEGLTITKKTLLVFDQHLSAVLLRADHVLHLRAQGKDRTHCGDHTPGQARLVSLISLFHYFPRVLIPFPALGSSWSHPTASPVHPKSSSLFPIASALFPQAPCSASSWPQPFSWLLLILVQLAIQSKKSLDFVWLTAWEVIHCQFILAYFHYRWPFQIFHVFKACNRIWQKSNVKISWTTKESSHC